MDFGNTNLIFTTRIFRYNPFLRTVRWILSSLVIEPTPFKNMLVKLEVFPNFRGENKQHIQNHHLVYHQKSTKCN